MLKKINSVFSLLSLLVLTVHICTASTEMLISSPAAPPVPVRMALGIFIVSHGVLSLLSIHAFGEGSSIAKYKELQKQTVLQRATGVGILVLALAHIAVAAFICIGIYTGAPIRCVSAVLATLLLVLLLPHLKLSFAKAFVTLGLCTREMSVFRLERFSAVFFPVLCAYGALGNIVRILRIVIEAVR